MGVGGAETAPALDGRPFNMLLGSCTRELGAPTPALLLLLLAPTRPVEDDVRSLAPQRSNSPGLGPDPPREVCTVGSLL